MREVDWTDKNGWRRRSVVRDDQDDADAPGGVQLGPPDVRGLDWEGVSRDLHNLLFDHGLFTWDDLQRSKVSLVTICESVLRRRVIMLFREPSPSTDTEV